MSNLPLNAVALLVLLALTWVASCVVHRRPETVRTQTEYVDRTLTEVDTQYVEVPRVRTVYRTETDTVNLCAGRPLYVPRSFELGGLVPRRPVSRQGRSLVLTTWQPDSLRWVQEAYRIPEPVWRFHLDVFGGTDLIRPVDNAVLGLRAEAWWRRYYTFAEGRADLGDALAEGSLTVGVGRGIIRWGR